MNKKKLRKKFDFRPASRKTVSGLFLVALILFLTACQAESKNQAEAYVVSLQAMAGSGYFWACSLSEEGIVRAESDQTIPDGLQYGDEYDISFRFYGEHYGTVSAEFTYARKNDEVMCIKKICELEVDRENKVTGEMSGDTLVLDPGEPGYSLICTDSSVVSWIDQEDGSYQLTPIREGSATVSLECPGDKDSEEKKYTYYLTVSEDLCFNAKEVNDGSQNSKCEDLEELKKNTGVTIKLPPEAEILEIRGVDEMGCVRFRYREQEFTCVAGNFDVSSFYGTEGKTAMIEGVSVGFPYSDTSLAGWSRQQTGYYLMSTELVSESLMKEVVAALLQLM